MAVNRPRPASRRRSGRSRTAPARLTAFGTGLDRRIIFLTGDAASGHAARLLDAAGAPVVFKPVELPELAARIEEHAREWDAG